MTKYTVKLLYDSSSVPPSLSSTLPTEGVFLHPSFDDGETGQTGLAGVSAMTPTNARDESSDDEELTNDAEDPAAVAGMSMCTVWDLGVWQGVWPCYTEYYWWIASPLSID